MTIGEFIQFCKRYAVSMLAVALAFLAVVAVAAKLAPTSTSYTAIAVSHMEVSTANDYDPENQYNHATRSQLAYQKIRNYDVLYAADDTIEKALDAAGIPDLTPDDVREAMSLTPDPDKLTETVEVTLDDKDTAIALANAIIDAAAAEIAEIEGPDTFMVSNIAPATEATTTINTTEINTKLIALGVLAAVLAAFGQAAYRHSVDRRVFTARNVQGLSDIPVLAVIPNNADPGEHMRHLRSSLLFAGLDGRPVVVSSATADGGKSGAFAHALARSFAAAERPTLLIRANAENPDSKGDTAAGLTDAFSKKTDLDSLLVDETSSLRTLPIGSAPGTAADALASPSVAQWIAAMSRDNVVIVDAGPANNPLAGTVNITVLHAGTATTDDVIRQTLAARFAENATYAFVLDEADFSRSGIFRYGNPGLVSAPQQ